MIIACCILMIVSYLASLIKPYGQAIASACAALAVVCAVVATLMGVVIMGYDQMLQGGMYTLIGGILTIVAVTAQTSNPQALCGSTTAMGAAAAAAVLILNLLAGAMS